ncbi:hypothetical protein Z517_06829 [Fonsecaea pedrosoi CBS 271.37]|uniref:Carrier domain-containing protein n=1 Tax=Fonsecaea pedrosoi CBS 271.37 TaxID=1442368 RepID=A0A0D2H6C8_9EURO|nr:uncharacterized protein Z517_06829 [Fonsecaea pedrosoi CBS 271.37]KIW80214.1 hypothetical protein Z517_06829 [Fonsecaea pedrosoi CBS 271.37]
MSSKASQEDVPQFGRRLLPTVIDERARKEPDKPVAYLQRSESLADGFWPVTFRLFANAVNRAAWWMKERVQIPEANGAVAYLGPFDIRYFIFIYAANKLGVQLFLPSPRNSSEAMEQLFAASKTRQLLIPGGETGKPYRHLVRGLEKSLETIEVEDLRYWLDSVPVLHYPYDKPYDVGKLDTHVISHTSGSTGIPKLIKVPNGQMCTIDAKHHLPEIPGHEWLLTRWKTATRFFTTFPPFHMGGVLSLPIHSIYGDIPTVFGPPGALSNVKLLTEAITYSEADCAGLLPTLVEEMSKSPEALKCLANLKYVSTGSGALSQEIGDFVNKHVVQLYNTVGSSECGLIESCVPPREDWQWIYWPKEYKMNGMVMRETGEPGTYEQVFIRHERYSLLQGCFHVFPDKQEFCTSDLYEKHPTKEDMWRPKGRADAVLVFSTGEKMNASAVEEIVRKHPKVSGVLVVGQGKFQPGILVELIEDLDLGSSDMNQLRNEIWELVQQANTMSPSHGQILQDFILMLDPSQRFSRTDKRSIKRQHTSELYQREIDALYSNAMTGSKEWLVNLSTFSESEVQASLRSYFLEKFDVESIDDHANLLNLGMDSLLVTALARRIYVGETSSIRITPQVIYSNPTIDSLARALKNMTLDSELEHGEQFSKVVSMAKDYYNKNKARLHAPESLSRLPKRRTNLHVLLTGSTGNLGRYLLQSLLKDERVATIPSIEEAKKSETLARSFPNKKVSSVSISPGAPDLGLTEESRRSLRDCDVIVHNGWLVNFNTPLQGFESLLDGMVSLVNFALSCPRQPRFCFVSTIGAVAGWEDTTQPVPEKPLEPWHYARGGYGTSKLVASKMLEFTTDKFGLDCDVYRVGQIAGPTTEEGQWNTTEWLPIIMKSSRYIQAVPENLGSMNVVDWVHVDDCAKVVAELALRESSQPGTHYFNISNPQICGWEDLLPAVQSAYKEVEVVSLPDWVQRVTALHDIDRNPALKLLDIFQGLDKQPRVYLETKETRAHSTVLDSMDRIQAEDMARFIRQWNF